MGISSSAGRLTLRGLKTASCWLDRVPTATGIVVLIYHRVGGQSGLRVDIPEWLFEEQMLRVASNPGVVTLPSALEDLQLAAPTAHPPVAVTFDDGTADFVDAALPIIVRHGVPVTIYLATDFIESGRSFPNDGKPVSWSALKDALSTGLVTIGSHTHTHLLLDRVSRRQAADELDRSVSLIGERLGVQALDFAYPKAVLGSGAVQDEVRARFRSAAVAGTRANPYGRTDVHQLARSPIQTDDGLRFFSRKVSGGMRFEDTVRQLVNRRRLAGSAY